MVKQLKKLFFSKKFIVILLIFCFSVGVRFIGLNKAGLGVDELYCPYIGVNMLDLVKKGDFSNKYWVMFGDPPPICHYIYGFFGQFDLKGYTKDHEPIFYYDITYSRLTSLAFNSFTVLFVALVGWEFITPFVGVAGSVIYSLIPSVVGLSQLRTQESIFAFFYTLNVYFFLRYLKKPALIKAFFIGVFISLALLTKLTNVFLLFVLLAIFFIWNFLKPKQRVPIKIKHIALLILGFFLTTFIVWPSLFINFIPMIEHTKVLRLSDVDSPWEWFLGRPVHVPKYYYVIQFLVRTPAALLLLSFLSALTIRSKKTRWIFWFLAAWFFIPFLQSFVVFKQQGIRYVAQVYAPFGLVVGLGIEQLVGLFTKEKLYKYTFLIIVVLYLFFGLASVYPYYLDYFNIFVGGVKGVYKTQMFEIGWWGNGGKDAGDYIITHAKKGSAVGYKLNPGVLIEKSDAFHYEKFQKNRQYDFVVTNYNSYQKVDYNNPELLRDYGVIYSGYNLVHTTTVDGVPLYKVYKNKNAK